MKTFLTGKLRSASLYWPPRNECLDNAKVERGVYACDECGMHFKRKELHVDHIEPVLDLEIGFVDWNTYISRLFCQAENLQALCKVCHSAKTMQEDAMRLHYRTIKRDKAKAEKDALKQRAKAWAKENKSTQKEFYRRLEEGEL